LSVGFLLHYKALRWAIGDYRNKISPKDLDGIFKCATPSQWIKYSNAKLMAIKLYNLDDGPFLSTKLKNQA